MLYVVSGIIYFAIAALAILALTGYIKGDQDRWYDVANQLVNLLPMLGILGTVGGLIFSGHLDDVDLLVSGLGQAMWTTFAGLAAAIGVKIVGIILQFRRNRREGQSDGK